MNTSRAIIVSVALICITALAIYFCNSVKEIMILDLQQQQINKQMEVNPIEEN